MRNYMAGETERESESQRIILGRVFMNRLDTSSSGETAGMDLTMVFHEVSVL